MQDKEEVREKESGKKRKRKESSDREREEEKEEEEEPVKRIRGNNTPEVSYQDTLTFRTDRLTGHFNLVYITFLITISLGKIEVSSFGPCESVLFIEVS